MTDFFFFRVPLCSVCHSLLSVSHVKSFAFAVLVLAARFLLSPGHPGPQRRAALRLLRLHLTPASVSAFCRQMLIPITRRCYGVAATARVSPGKTTLFPLSPASSTHVPYVKDFGFRDHPLTHPRTYASRRFALAQAALLLTPSFRSFVHASASPLSLRLRVSSGTLGSATCSLLPGSSADFHHQVRCHAGRTEAGN